MKLIIQNIDGVLYAYRETERHFRKVEKQRPRRIDADVLKDDCDLLDALQPGEHFVFEIK